MWEKIADRFILLVAFLAVLGVYATLELHGGSSDATGPLRDLLLALVGALAGISLPRGTSGGGQ